MPAPLAEDRRDAAVSNALSESALALEAAQLFQQVGDQIDGFLRKQKLSRSQAARLFGRPESFIADRIKGRNLTLRTLAEFAATVGAEVTITLRPRRTTK